MPDQAVEVSYRRATPQDAETLVRFCIEMAQVRLALSIPNILCLWARAAAHTMYGLQESEGVKLDPQTVARGVDTLLQTPSKGEYFVGEVRPVEYTI